MKPMFSEICKKSTGTIPSRKDRRCATLLYGILSKRRVLTAPYSLEGWSNHFRLLRQVSKIKGRDILQVLKWYSHHYDEQYTPRAWSAETFRRKFIQIREAMQRQQKQQGPALDEEGKKTLANITMNMWRKVSDQNLQSAVARSVANYKLASSRLREHRVKFHPKGVSRSDTMRIVVAKILHALFFNTVHDITSHLNSVWRSHHAWEAWNGNMEPHIFGPKHKDIILGITKICEIHFGTGSVGVLAVEYIKDVFGEEGYL